MQIWACLSERRIPRRQFGRPSQPAVLRKPPRLRVPGLRFDGDTGHTMVVLMILLMIPTTSVIVMRMAVLVMVVVES